MGLAGASIKFSTLHTGVALKALAVAAAGKLPLPEQHNMVTPLQHADTRTVAQHCMFHCTSMTVACTLLVNSMLAVMPGALLENVQSLAQFLAT